MIDFRNMPNNVKLQFLPEAETNHMYFISRDNKYVDAFATAPPPDRVIIPDYQKVEPERAGTASYFVNALLPVEPEQWETVTRPRQHHRRSNQSEAYHKRISKKWAKRKLTVTVRQLVTEPVVLRLPSSVMHKISRRIGTIGARVHNNDLHLNLDIFNVKQRKLR
jgi:hypothetical protein